MNSVLILIDLQNDFLHARSLEPSAGEIVHNATEALRLAREQGIPVIHVWTTVRGPGDELDNRMPHWQRADKWACVTGTLGHATPKTLQSIEGEPVIHKQFFSAFENEQLDSALKAIGADTLLLAGVHLHGCIRSAALDGYRRGYQIVVLEDAVGSDDPLHAAITQRYLEKRDIRFVPLKALASLFGAGNLEKLVLPPCWQAVGTLPVAFIGNERVESSRHEIYQHRNPNSQSEIVSRVPLGGERDVDQALVSASLAGNAWRTTSMTQRVEILLNWSRLIEANRETLVSQMALEVGKPVGQGRAEVDRAVQLIKTVVSYADEPLEYRSTANSIIRHRPLGTVAIITPWNNPVAIPVGKIAPALLYGNSVVWKPALPGSGVALQLVQMLCEAGLIPSAVNVVVGDRRTAASLMAQPSIDAVTITGSIASGYAAQEICATRHIPLQAELGGNNAAIVWHDANIEHAACEIAAGAFGFAGQRCTANRRVIVDDAVYDDFLQAVVAATSALIWGEPTEAETQVGPVISVAARERVEAVVQRAREAGCEVVVPHRGQANHDDLMSSGAFYPPTIVCCDNPDVEIVQEETFGPVLVVQRARDWQEALTLCNAVRQGLAAALFSQDAERQQQFLSDIKAGIVKVNTSTANADAKSPFGGWKASAIGPAEHGLCNRDFYTRVQTVYA